MITMYEMIMTNTLDANACLTPRGVTTILIPSLQIYGEGEVKDANSDPPAPYYWWR
jgi:hypothetical protein